MANQFLEQLERFKRNRKARSGFEDDVNVEELNVDDEEEALRKPIQRRRTYERENWKESCWYKISSERFVGS